MRHLAERGVLVPAPIANQDGEILSVFCGKPASLVTKLEGDWQPEPGPAHCAAVGAMMAKMHLAGSDYPLYQPNLRGLDWWVTTAPVVLPYLAEDNRELLMNEIRYQQEFAASDTYSQLPRGPIHADLFRNNVMFMGEKLSGFFDFYFAGYDTWLFDLAVAVNDWCIDLDTGELDMARMQAFLSAYHAVRPCSAAEQLSWQPVLRAASLRFWLSRLYDFYLPRAAEMLTPHDPRHFERILRDRISKKAPFLF
jgi:homoserine kinase type II